MDITESSIVLFRNSKFSCKLSEETLISDSVMWARHLIFLWIQLCGEKRWVNKERWESR